MQVTPRRILYRPVQMIIRVPSNLSVETVVPQMATPGVTDNAGRGGRTRYNGRGGSSKAGFYLLCSFTIGEKMGR